MYINGEWVSAKSGKMFDVFNPADGEPIGQVPDGGRADAAEAIEAAGEAFKLWSGTTAYQRSGYLYEAYRIMMARKEDLARLMTREQGKPLKAARNEVQYGADFLLWFAEEAKRVYGETIPAPAISPTTAGSSPARRASTAISTPESACRAAPPTAIARRGRSATRSPTSASAPASTAW